jgi:hypothetical protein
MIVLSKVLFCVQFITIVLWLAYLGWPAAVVLRLRGAVPGDIGSTKLSFSEFLPVPHAQAGEGYVRGFPRSHALRMTGILYKVALSVLIVFVSLDLFRRFFIYP